MRRLFRITQAWGLFALACVPTAQGQTTEIADTPFVVFDRWSVADGLPLNHITDLAIGPDQRVWVSTFEGIASLDGNGVSVYRQGLTPGLTANRFVDVEVDDAGDAWVVSETAQLFRIRDGRATQLRPGQGAVSTVARAGRALWAVGDHVWEIRDGDVHDVPVGLGPGRVRSIAGGRSDDLWFGMDEPSQLVHARWVDTEWKVERVVPLAAAHPQRLLPTPDGDLWLAARSGTWRVPSSGQPVLEVPSPPGKPWTRPYLSSDNTVWVSRDDGAAWQWDGERAQLIPTGIVPPDAGSAAGWTTRGSRVGLEGTWAFTAHGPARVMALDGSGLPWIEDLAGGLLKARSVPFRSVGDDSLGPVQCVAHAPLGGLFACVESGLVRVGEQTNEPVLGVELAADALAVDVDGHLLVASDRTLCRVQEQACIPVGGWPEMRPLFGLAVREDGSVLAVGPEGVFHATRTELGTLDRVDRWWFEPDSLLRRVTPLADGTALVTSRGRGLLHVGPFTSTVLDMDGGLPNASTRGLYLDEVGFAWFGTEGGGLCRVRAPDGAPLDVTTLGCLGADAGLPFTAINAVTEDAEGRLWVSGNGGVFSMTRTSAEAVLAGRADQPVLVQYGARDGMVEPETNGRYSPSVAHTPDGHVWFPTMRGLLELAPEHIPAASLPAVRIESLMADGVDVLPQARAGVVRLSVDAAVLDVTFTAVSFEHPEQLQFRARLVGVDRGWRSPQGRRISWSSLPAGSHQLELQAGWPGAWNAASTQVRIVRPPSLWERWWVGPVAGIALGLLVVLFGVWRVRAALRRGAELETAVAERTEELAARNTQIQSQADLLGEQNARIRAQAEALVERNAHIAAQADRLTQLDEVRTRFVAQISHELRTPLSLVLGPLQQLAEQADIVQSPVVRRALRSAERLDELVDQLLDVARLQAGGVRLRARRLDLAADLRRICSLFGGPGDAALVTVTAPAQPVVVWCDADLIEKVMTNLLGNAMAFATSGGQVHVRLEVDESTVRVCVDDDGPGVPIEARERIFEPFEQADTGDRRGHDGAGIGLSLAAELVGLHGGEIGVHDGELGGASFWFRLPLGTDHIDLTEVDDMPRNDHVPEGPSLPPASNERPCLLVVEDHPDMRAYLQEQLVTHFDVVLATDGEAAWRRMENWVPDVVVSDVMMPGLDGVSLCRRMRADERLRRVPVLLLSAKGTETDRVAGLEVADDYLTKPFSVRELVLRLGHLGGRSVTADVESRWWPVALGDECDGLEQEPAFGNKLVQVLLDGLSNADFSVKRLAQQMALSPRQLQRRTTAALGKSPAAVLRDARLRIAQRMLVSCEVETVAEAAHAVGMSPAYFSRVYANWVGHPPSHDLTQGATAAPD